jgi:hypothetical protein
MGERTESVCESMDQSVSQSKTPVCEALRLPFRLARQRTFTTLAFQTLSPFTGLLPRFRIAKQGNVSNCQLTVLSPSLYTPPVRCGSYFRSGSSDSPLLSGYQYSWLAQFFVGPGAP